jgi:hypothetical protein
MLIVQYVLSEIYNYAHKQGSYGKYYRPAGKRSYQGQCRIIDWSHTNVDLEQLCHMESTGLQWICVLALQELKDIKADINLPSPNCQLPV